jgi:hypothetical protein
MRHRFAFVIVALVLGTTVETATAGRRHRRQPACCQQKEWCLYICEKGVWTLHVSSPYWRELVGVGQSYGCHWVPPPIGGGPPYCGEAVAAAEAIPHCSFTITCGRRLDGWCCSASTCGGCCSTSCQQPCACRTYSTPLYLYICNSMGYWEYHGTSANESDLDQIGQAQYHCTKVPCPPAQPPVQPMTCIYTVCPDRHIEGTGCLNREGCSCPRPAK